MYEIRAGLTPEQVGAPVLLVRESDDPITVSEVYVHGADARRQIVSVETSTPKARAFFERSRVPPISAVPTIRSMVVGLPAEDVL